MSSSLVSMTTVSDKTHIAPMGMGFKMRPMIVATKMPNKCQQLVAMMLGSTPSKPLMPLQKSTRPAGCGVTQSTTPMRIVMIRLIQLTPFTFPPGFFLAMAASVLGLSGSI